MSGLQRSTSKSHRAVFHVLRLIPGDDLLLEIKRFVDERGLHAAFIASAVGSVGKCIVRPAGASNAAVFIDSKFEIVSLSGTLEAGGACHLHISVSDESCNVKGGHVLEGCVVRTTAEIVLGSLPDLTFTRALDSSGYDELFINEVI
jgi:predicted DNA-binding protein with PD1-like motif